MSVPFEDIKFQFREISSKEPEIYIASSSNEEDKEIEKIRKEEKEGKEKVSKFNPHKKVKGKYDIY